MRNRVPLDRRGSHPSSLRIVDQLEPSDAWPDSEEGERARLWWGPTLATGVNGMIANSRGGAAVILGDGIAMPVTLSRTAPGESYVTSAVSLYLDYARYEASRLLDVRARGFASGALAAVAPLLRRLDPVVFLDDWALSTNLRPPRSPAIWEAATRLIERTWPGRAIVVRNLDSRYSVAALTDLEALGYRRVLTRRVFFQDPRDPALWSRRNVQIDLRLERREPVEWRPVEPGDAPAVAALYWELYGGKYSPLNPRFRAEWIANGVVTGILYGEAIWHGGRMLAVYLSYTIGGLCAQPIFGYSLAAPERLGLYRRLSLRTLQTARARGVVVHASAGAARFKLLRGGIASDEYVAVHTRGCSAAQRAAWNALRVAADRLGPRMLESAS